MWLDVQISPSKFHRTLYEHVYVVRSLQVRWSELPGLVFYAGVCVCVCVGADVQWHSVGVIPLGSVGVPSWCSGLFSGSNT